MKKMMLMVVFAITQMLAVTIIDNPTSETVTVKVSNRSVNRIVLPSKILDVAYSKEKGVDIKINGNQAFIKYIPIKKEKLEQIGKNKMKPVGEPEIIYTKAKPAEVFFVTENKTYTFALIPKNIKAQTIIVNDFTKKAKEILKYETEDDYVTVLAKITTQILKGNTPLGYQLKPLNEQIGKEEGKRYIVKAVYKGVLYNAYLIDVINTTKKPMTIDAKKIAKFSPGKPKAVTVYYGNEANLLLPFQKAQVVIIVKAEK
ncbi:TraK domain-containing protein [Nitrosophilus labii]|uniref:TraK domain-containing protein n=1 Tax=Nitrosophilus labii TaxID=2706014 RepID=UPI00165753B8|nr:type-F conjugative transfer system secretin TraK [Nitrosophilus labii]